MFVPIPPSGEDRTLRLTENRYVVVLPPSLLLTLHDIHPLVALGAINGALTFSIVTLVFGLVGVRKRRTRDTGRGVPLSVRIKRALR